jgi:hypothetical protein
LQGAAVSQEAALCKASNKHNIDAESSLLDGTNNKTNKKQTESYRPNQRHHDEEAAIAACLKYLSVSCAVPAGE